MSESFNFQTISKQEQYSKEQENYQSKKLAAKTDAERQKVDLNFMYELPPSPRIEENSEPIEVGEGKKDEKEV